MGGGLGEGGRAAARGGRVADDGKRWHSVGVLFEAGGKENLFSREGGV